MEERDSEVLDMSVITEGQEGALDRVLGSGAEDEDVSEAEEA